MDGILFGVPPHRYDRLMLCGTFRSTVLVRIAALIVAVTFAAVACGAQEEGGGANPQPR